MADRTPPRLERSCGPHPRDWLRSAPPAEGIERIEAFFAGHGFDPHRHDQYALGVTLAGVQAFRYRGAERRSPPGQAFVLHPDEVHDGHAGDAAGFRYRILYIAPRLVSDALAPGCPLPFVPAALPGDRRLGAAIRAALATFGGALEDLERDQLVWDLAQALALADPSTRRPRRIGVDARAIRAACDFLEANAGRPVASADLERVTGLSRFTLARQFRAALGTSPHRYHVQRRLDRARAQIAAGTPLADVASDCGFADQSHLTRHFHRAYGLTPGRWAALAGVTPLRP